ncbi:MAG: ribonuclease P protein component [Chitinophagaceae bacterium]|nr:ribonuclease P protein component [Chitinophagaceae bacterium]
MKNRFTLHKRERLKSRKRIELLFREGKRFSVAPFRVVYLIRPAGSFPLPSELQFGVSVGKKFFKKAVDRNRIKRLMREAYRLRKPELLKKIDDKSLQLLLFVIFTGREIPDFALVNKQMEVILNKLIHIADENYPEHP